MIKEVGIRRILASDRFQHLLTPRRDNHLWITSTPKSGSTWIYQVLSDLLKWPSLHLVTTWERCEQELEPRLLLRKSGCKNVISPNIHCKMNANTIGFCLRPEVGTIIVVRDLADSMVSLMDHIDGKGSREERFFWPFVHVSASDWDHLDRKQKLGFLVHHAAPWYVNFYVGWYRFFISAFERRRIAFVRYEEFIQDPYAGIHRILTALRLPSVSDHEIGEALRAGELGYTRKNRAITGRGDELDVEQMAQLRKLASFYQEIDFEPLLPQSKNQRGLV